MAANLDAILQQHWNVLPVKLIQPGIGVYVDFSKRDTQGPQGRSHLFAEMAVRAPVEFNPCRQGPRW